MIDSYIFGSIVIDGREYRKDLIIYPDRIDPTWWRREGHRLLPEDLSAVIGYEPDILVVGTGASGRLDVPDKTRSYVGSKGIELIVAETKRACELFNELEGEKRVVAALHITC